MDHEYTSTVTGSITHAFTPRDDGSGTLLRRLVKEADSLGIALPKDALEHFQRGEDLRTLARQAMNQEPSGITDLAKSLGHGETTAKKAADSLPTALAAQSLDLQRSLVRLYAEANTFAQRAARKALHRAGDKLLEAPRRLAEKALQDPRNLDAQDTWDRAQAYASLLRLMGMVPLAEGATDREYIYTSPDLAAEYQAKTGQAPSLAVIGQHREEFGAAILTASQVVEAASAYTQPEDGDQEREPGASVVWDTEPGSGGQRVPVSIKRG